MCYKILGSSGLLALFIPDHSQKHILFTALWTLGGGALGLLTQVAVWPFRPQHPVRRIVSDSWLAAADLFDGLKSDDLPDAAALALRQQNFDQNAAALRDKLEKGRDALRNARTPRNAAFLQRLEHLNSLAGGFTRCALALHSALENATRQNSALAELRPAFQPILNSFANNSRTIALAVVSRQPEHLALAEVRVRRLGHLLQGFSDKTAALDAGASLAAPSASPAPGNFPRQDVASDAPTTAADLAALTLPVFDKLKELIDTLRTTIDRAAERAAFSLELLDTDTWSLRPLASALNFSRKIDPALVRFAARLTMLQVLGVIIARVWHLPHGYWLGLTIIIVIQPDFGATRQRAAQRALGTFFGGLLGSALVWLPMPDAAKFALMAAFLFVFICCLRHNYGIAVFFLTPQVVLLTEMSQAVSWQFTLERVLSTAGGALLAIIAALLFWPTWERSRIPKNLVRAIRANLEYWQTIFAHIETGRPLDAAANTAYYRADAANAEAFASLQRMMGDPANQREGIEQTAAIANGNQRLTQALNVIALRITRGEPLIKTGLAPCVETGARTLRTLAETINQPHQDGIKLLTNSRREMDALRLPKNWENATNNAAINIETRDRTRQVVGQLARAGTELNAMLLASETCLREGVFGG